MKNISVVGIDLSKNYFQVCAMTKQGEIIFNKRVTRNELPEVVQKLPSTTISMESCCGAHFWARKFQQMGHIVKLISPQFVKPFVKSNKNDANDSEAIAIASSQGHMRFVPMKNIEQQEIQGLHKTRELYVKQYTAVANHIRSLLLEHGIIIPKGVKKINKNIWLHIDDINNELTPNIREQLKELYEHFNDLQKKATAYEKKLTLLARQDERCKNLLTMPGIGPLISTALVSAIGNGHEFKKGKELSAWLGLVPKQHSSGNKQRLLGISKRGDKYLRKLLIHGARSALIHCTNKTDKLSLWMQRKKESLGFNKATVALANKNARIALALLNNNTIYIKQ